MIAANRMNQRDLTVVTGAIKQCTAYTCLLSGRPCNLVPVTLRRMMIIPPIVWIGWRAVVILPLEKSPALAVWQYMRMLRPYAVITALGLGPIGLMTLFNAEPGRPLAIGLGLTALAAVVALWIALGRLLNKYEFVRLLRYSNSKGTVTIRFSTAELAQRAQQVLVLPEEVDLENVLLPQHIPAPRTRPVFRYMAGVAAVLFFIAATGIYFGADEPEAWKPALGALVMGLLMGAIALGKKQEAERIR